MGIFKSIISHAEYAALVLVAIVGGFIPIGKGISRTTHEESRLGPRGLVRRSSNYGSPHPAARADRGRREP
jgi:hypothetical protein